MKTFRDLLIWQKSKDLSLQIYSLTKKFPKSETFGLSDQLRRAAVSIPSNIAEGYCRSTQRDFYQFLRIALGSCAEVETQIEISKELEYIHKAEYEDVLQKIHEIQKMLQVFLSKVKQNFS